MYRPVVSLQVSDGMAEMMEALTNSEAWREVLSVNKHSSVLIIPQWTYRTR